MPRPDFYDSSVIPQRVSSDAFELAEIDPVGNEDKWTPRNLPPSHPRPVEIKPAQAKTSFVRGALQLSWDPQPNTFYVVEASEDLENWHPHEILHAQSQPINWRTELTPQSAGEPSATGSSYFRVRTVETAAPDPAGTPLLPR
jgi:hypothetical protein